MDKELAQNIREYIFNNIGSDLSKLQFAKFPFEEENRSFIFQQIAARQKALKKLPTYVNNMRVVFPSAVSVEQTSSEATAKFKSTLVSGDSLIDITGGLGVDCLYFSKKIKKVVYCERNEALAVFAKHNFKELGADNIDCFHENGISFLFNNETKFDWVYVDPARRDAANNKMYHLSDCEPNLELLQQDLLFKAKNALIKTSPMLDISLGLKQFNYVSDIYIVAVKNEVKELLWKLNEDANLTPRIFAVNITNDRERIEEVNPKVTSCEIANEVKGYLYEPFAAIMKSGHVNYLSAKYNVKKLAEFSHLFVSDECIDFPGRVFKIVEVHSYQKKNYANWQSKQLNISTRNFFETPEVLRKKFKIKDGGTRYVFFTTSLTLGKVVLFCEKI
jgi:predicted O-methyltransferase YrrM